jgi:hypothetical protein
MHPAPKPAVPAKAPQPKTACPDAKLREAIHQLRQTLDRLPE